MSRQKKAMSLFYSYRHNEFKELNYHQVGIITLALLEYDETGQICEELQKEIDNDILIRMMMRVMKDKTERATKKWYEINNRFENARNKKNADTVIDDDDDDEDFDDDED